MSKVLKKIKEMKFVDASVAIRGTDNDGGILVEAKLIQFLEKDGGSAQVVKNVNAYARHKDLEKAQDAALERAGVLLGLEE